MHNFRLLALTKGIIQFVHPGICCKLLTLIVCLVIISLNPLILCAQEDPRKYTEKLEQEKRQKEDDEWEKEQNLKQNLEQSPQLIVMLSMEYGEIQEFGAGIIFGHDKDRLLIATANHLLHRGNMQPKKVRVKFKTINNKVFDAVILKRSNEAEMDLAVIGVDDCSKHGIDVCTISFRHLGNVADLKRGAAVFPLGNPNGVSWAMPVEPDRVAQITGNNIVFQSAFISSGHSGGALLDENANIVGMNTTDQPPFGTAINMDVILGQIRHWNYPVQLGIPVFGGDSPLHVAAMKGDLVEIRNLLAHCGNVNAKGYGDATPLHYAAQYGQANAISLLLQAGAKVDIVDGGINTPLDWAVHKGHLESVKLLVKAGARMDFHKDYERRPLYIAAYQGNKDIVKFLIAAGAGIEDEPGNYHTPLYAAADGGHLEVVKLMIAAGAKATVNTLYKPVFYGRADIVKAILEATINLNDKLNPNLPKLYPEGVKNLLQLSVRAGKLEIVKLLVLAGADVNALSAFYQPLCMDCTDRDLRNCTPLFAAIELWLSKTPYTGRYQVDSSQVDWKHDDYSFKIDPREVMWHYIDSFRRGYIAMADFLVAHGGKIKGAENSVMDAVLEEAVRKNQTGAVKLLLAAGASADKERRSLLLCMAVSENVNVNIIKELIDAGANVNFCGSWIPLKNSIRRRFIRAYVTLFAGRTNYLGSWAPLQLAAQIGNDTTIRVLLESGADVNKKDPMSSAGTPLLEAILGGHLDAVRVLLRYKANPNKTEGGITPLEMAVRTGKVEILELLLDSGGDVNLETSDRKTLLATASALENKPIADLLRARGAK